MPGGIGSIIGKGMGPAEMALGLALAYPTAGATLPLALQGATSTFQPGGVANPIGQPSAPPPPPNAPQGFTPPSATALTSIAGQGLGMPGVAASAPASSNVNQMPYDIAQNMMANSPFATQSAWSA